jgi:hypothetical protein
MSFTLIYGLFALILVLGVFLATYRFWGWKAALGLSLLSSILLAGLLLALIAIITRNM